MPAIAMPGAYSNYFARTHGGVQERFLGNGALQPPLPLGSNWSVGGAGIQPTSTWPLAGNHGSAVPYANTTNQPLSVPKGWRNGDWICNCGFHNYSSRAQCKNCNSPMPPALGTKRLASEDFVQDWDNKRLNSGHTSGQQQPHVGFDQMLGAIADQKTAVYAPYPSLSTAVVPDWPAPVPFPHQATAPTLLGKGAKHWRSGDWMCANCNNHNYASRAQCNRCKTQRDADPLLVNAAPQPLNATSQPVDAV